MGDLNDDTLFIIIVFHRAIIGLLLTVVIGVAVVVTNIDLVRALHYRWLTSAPVAARLFFRSVAAVNGLLAAVLAMLGLIDGPTH